MVHLQSSISSFQESFNKAVRTWPDVVANQSARAARPVGETGERMYQRFCERRCSAFDLIC